jgi:hypothetical protein
MLSLDLTYHALGRYEEARALEGEVLPRRKSVLGDDRLMTLFSISHPGQLADRF